MGRHNNKKSDIAALESYAIKAICQSERDPKTAPRSLIHYVREFGVDQTIHLAKQRAEEVDRLPLKEYFRMVSRLVQEHSSLFYRIEEAFR